MRQRRSIFVRGANLTPSNSTASSCLEPPALAVALLDAVHPAIIVEEGAPTRVADARVRVSE